MWAKISKQLASHHASQSLSGRSRTLNESREVGRTDHVEVDIESDVPTHVLGQCAEMMAGADETALLCPPECEAYASAGSAWPRGQSQRRLEHYSRTATIVVDAWPLRHAVEMRTNDDQGAIAIQAVSASTFRVSRLPVTALTSRRTPAPPRAAISSERPSWYGTPTTGMGAS